MATATVTRDSVRKMKEEQASVWSEGRALLDDIGTREEWTGEEDETWARINRSLDESATKIQKSEEILDFEARDNNFLAKREDEGKKLIKPDEDEYRRIFESFVRSGRLDMTPEDRAMLAKNQQEIRAQSAGTGSAGGYLVPDGFWERISETMLAFGGAQAVVNNITTSTGQALPWPTNDDTGNTGAILGENEQITEQDLEFGFRSLGAYTYTSKLIRVSWELLQDSAFDVEGFITRKAAERLARIYNTHLTTGNGSNQPKGLVTGAVTGKTTASATAITFNETIDLIHSIDPAYRNLGRARFMFSDGVLAYLRKVRDDSGGAGLGRPIWEPSVQVGEPNTIHGFPYTINQDMAQTVAAANATMLFGDFQDGYVQRTVRGNQLVRLDEKYADYLQTGYFLFGRMDGTTDDTGAYAALVQTT